MLPEYFWIPGVSKNANISLDKFGDAVYFSFT